MASRSLCSPETALSRRTRPKQLRLPKGASYSPSLVKEMIEADAAIGFDIPVPLHPKTGKPICLEISMPAAVMHHYQQARNAHPNAINLPPMVIVERGSMEHFRAFIKGGLVYVKEDPLNPTVINDGAPDFIKVFCQANGDSQQS